MIDLDWIQRLIRIVDDSGVDTLEVSRFATRVRVSKSPPEPPSAPAGVGSGGGGASPASEPAVGSETAGEQDTSAPGPDAEAEEVASRLHEVSSPMVGTFYRAPAPDAPAYVEVGDRVEEGQTLCILEAMKLMNELDSEVSGLVEEVCAENGEPVEYGDVLFRIDTDAG